jgi:hypothetical protein
VGQVSRVGEITSAALPISDLVISIDLWMSDKSVITKSEIELSAPHATMVR